MNMSAIRSQFRIALLAVLALGAVPSFALAQHCVPDRIGNIWSGLPHEPVPSVVDRDQQKAGIAPPPAQQNQTTDDVERLYRQLMREEGQPQQQPR